jgi:hypothetical protein
LASAGAAACSSMESKEGTSRRREPVRLASGAESS